MSIAPSLVVPFVGGVIVLESEISLGSFTTNVSVNEFVSLSVTVTV